MAETYEKLMSGVTPALTDSARLVTANGGSNKALLSAVAKLILESYTGTSLETTAQNVADAINELAEASDDLREDVDSVIPTFTDGYEVIGGN